MSTWRTFCRPEGSTLSLDPLPCALLLAQFGNPWTDPFLDFVLANQLLSIEIYFRLQGYIFKYTWSASHGATFEILPLAPPHIFLCLRWLRVPWKVCLHRDFTHPEISLGLRSSSPQAPYSLHLWHLHHRTGCNAPCLLFSPTWSLRLQRACATSRLPWVCHRPGSRASRRECWSRRASVSVQWRHPLRKECKVQIRLSKCSLLLHVTTPLSPPLKYSRPPPSTDQAPRTESARRVRR